jgi:hypothetical protein
LLFVLFFGMIVRVNLCDQLPKVCVMLYQPEIDQDAQPVHSGDNLAHWRAPSTGNRLDCETGILLRRTLHSEFETASCWASLQDGLKSRGFALGFREGRLMLTDINAEQFICSCRFLGWPLADLAARFGKLRARADTGTERGQIIC